MKEIIALLVFGILVYIAIRYFNKKNNKVGTIFLVFALLCGFGIAMYDEISKISGLGTEIERAKETKTELINTRVELITLKEEALQNLTNQIEYQKSELLKLNQDAENTKREIERLNYLSKRIAEASTKMVYLQGQTKNEFGGVRDETAWNEIEKELNDLLILIFPDSIERSLWIQNLEQTLPPRSS